MKWVRKIFRRKPKKKAKAPAPLADLSPPMVVEQEVREVEQEIPKNDSEDNNDKLERQEEMTREELIENSNNIENPVEENQDTNSGIEVTNVAENTMEEIIEDTELSEENSGDGLSEEQDEDIEEIGDELEEIEQDVADRVEDNPADISEIIGNDQLGTNDDVDQSVAAQIEENHDDQDAPAKEEHKEEQKIATPVFKKKETKLASGEYEKNIRQRLEVLLFMSREPLSKDDLLKFLQCEREALDQELFSLQTTYDSPEHGIQIIQISDKFQFATKAEYTKTVEDYINAPTEVSLSAAALETLAIIAYRQPITRTEVEAIRGVNSDGIMKSLQDKEFIEECGKAETIGRPTLYGTTEVFLKHFGLKDLNDLPGEPRALMESQEAEETLRIFRHSLVSQAELELNNADAPAEQTVAG